MHKLLLLAISLMICLIGFSQNKFEKGYYIKNNGSKVECLIKNLDWRNNPTKFDYRLSENSETEKESIQAVKKFVITDKLIFERYEVQLDTSDNLRHNLDLIKEPKFKKQTVFLKVLIQGKSNLYAYKKGSLRKYFYSLEDEVPIQLIYKLYLTYNKKNGANIITANNQFKRQLLIDLKCGIISTNQLDKLSYNEKSLISYFNQFNNCGDSDGTNFTINQVKRNGELNLTARGGINFLSMHRASPSSDIDFGIQTKPYLGVELEFPLPFNNNKWSLLLEPQYYAFKSLKNAPSEPLFSTVSVNYAAITLPLGIRHSFFLNSNSKIFINTLYRFSLLDINIEDQIVFDRGGTSKLFLTSPIILGLGVKYKKSSVEIRYSSNSYLSSDTNFLKSNDFAIIYGLSIF